MGALVGGVVGGSLLVAAAVIWGGYVRNWPREGLQVLGRSKSTSDAARVSDSSAPAVENCPEDGAFSASPASARSPPLLACGYPGDKVAHAVQ